MRTVEYIIYDQCMLAHLAYTYSTLWHVHNYVPSYIVSILHGVLCSQWKQFFHNPASATPRALLCTCTCTHTHIHPPPHTHTHTHTHSLTHTLTYTHTQCCSSQNSHWRPIRCDRQVQSWHLCQQQADWTQACAFLAPKREAIHRGGYIVCVLASHK